MQWVIYFLSAGLSPILLLTGVVFLVLGYSGRLGSWLVILVVLNFGREPNEVQAQNLTQSIPTGTSVIVPSSTSTETTDPLLLVLGTATPTIQSQPTQEQTPSLSPTAESVSLDASRECEDVFNPPCTYTLQGEVSIFAVAQSVTHDEDLALLYAGLVRDLNRNINGYIARTPPQLRVPSADATRDLSYYQFYFSDMEWDVCGGVPIDTPCYYVVGDQFVEEEINSAYNILGAELFPQTPNASECIILANQVNHLGGNFYAPKPLEPGAVLIIPNLSREYCIQ
jgi:hypothetical protein